MKIRESAGKIKVGMNVEVRCPGLTSSIFGYVGELVDNGFYVWQGIHDGTFGKHHPAEGGFPYSWHVSFRTDSVGEVTIRTDSEGEVTIINSNVKQEKGERTMKDSIAQVFDKTKDALLVEKYFGEEINPGFIAEITIRDHKDEILAEARRRETAATMSE